MRPSTPRAPRLAWLLLVALTVSACAVSNARRAAEQVIEEGDSADASPAVHADLIRRMLDQDQNYAALAHTQARVRLSGSSPEFSLLEAEARRKLGQTEEAKAVYRQLLKGPYVAEAYHGLGLISAATDLKTAVWQLQQSVQRRPADARIRNDLGYALMVAGRYREALPELATAVELEAPSGSDKARNNLVLLMLLTGDEASARQVVQQSGMTPETLAGLRRQAQSLARKPAASGVAAGRKG